MTIKKKLSKEMEGVQSLVSQLQEQAGNGEIDQSLIDRLAAAVEVSLEQGGDTHDTVQDAVDQTAPAAPAPVEPAPAAPAAPKTEDEEAQKVMTSRPPRVQIHVPGEAVDEFSGKLPSFIKALETGSLRKAQEIADIKTNGQQYFDEVFKMALQNVMDEEGITYRNLGKIHSGFGDTPGLAKGMDSTSLPGVNLMRLARLMMPVYAGLVRRFPTNTPESGSDKASWRVRMGFQNVNWASLLSSSEADKGQEINEPFAMFEAPYRDLAVWDEVTLKGIAAARGYDDPMQVSVMTGLTIILSGQEKKLLGDNATAIAKPDKATAVGKGTTGTVGSATAKFYVTALTYRGWLAASKGGTDAVGETDASTVSDAVDLSACDSVTVTWPAVPGAVAYNVFYNASAATKYYAGTFSTTKAVLTSLPTEGNAPSATNKSANANGYEGLLSWCELNTVYTKTILNKQAITDLKGAPLTKGTSGITEIDRVLAAHWTNWKIAPTCMVMSANHAGAMTDLMMGLGQYRIELSAERGSIAGGMFMSSYTNKFAPYADGTPRTIDIIPHPDMMDGTILFLCETIPYKQSRETRGFAREPLIPYTYFPLGATKAAYPYTMQLSETFECFHPSPQTALVGVALE